MIDCQKFYQMLFDRGVDFFTGVPDSLLKYLCACVTDCTPPQQHVIAANEGAAVAIAVGHYLATSRLALVYMQNSGQGNAVNPLVSLADPSVYAIPMLLLIGWRGEPGVKDEPQHAKQGEVTLGVLEALGIPYSILPETEKEASIVVGHLISESMRMNGPVAMIAKKSTFAPYRIRSEVRDLPSMTRELAITTIVRTLGTGPVYVSTTGKMSRELYEHREIASEGHERDFLTVGSMGHASSIALGIAMSRCEHEVYCLDGDGAAIMHMGAMAIIGASSATNLKHVVLNNGAHESVGGQPTVGFDVSFVEIARACGYRSVACVDTQEELRDRIKWLARSSGPGFLEVRIRQGSRADLGRPAISPVQNKVSLMERLSSK